MFCYEYRYVWPYARLRVHCISNTIHKPQVHNHAKRYE